MAGRRAIAKFPVCRLDLFKVARRSIFFRQVSGRACSSSSHVSLPPGSCSSVYYVEAKTQRSPRSSSSLTPPEPSCHLKVVVNFALFGLRNDQYISSAPIVSQSITFAQFGTSIIVRAPSSIEVSKTFKSDLGWPCPFKHRRPLWPQASTILEGPTSKAYAISVHNNIDIT